METGKTEDNEDSSNGSYQEDDGSKEIEELHEAGENASTDEIVQNDSINLGEKQDKDQSKASQTQYRTYQKVFFRTTMHAVCTYCLKC